MIGSGISRNWQPRSFSWGMYQWIHFFCSPSRGTYSWSNIKYGSHTPRNTGPVNSQWTFLQLKPTHYAAVSDRTVKFALPLYEHGFCFWDIFIQLIHVEIFTCNNAFYLVFLQCLSVYNILLLVVLLLESKDIIYLFCSVCLLSNTESTFASLSWSLLCAALYSFLSTKFMWMTHIHRCTISIIKHSAFASIFFFNL